MEHPLANRLDNHDGILVPRWDRNVHIQPSQLLFQRLLESCFCDLPNRCDPEQHLDRVNQLSAKKKVDTWTRGISNIDASINIKIMIEYSLHF